MPDLLPHQDKFVRHFARNLRPHMIAGEVGTGKTAAAIMLDVERRDQKRWTNPTLIVCPKSLITNWQREIKSWTDQDAFIIDGLTRTEREIALMEIARQKPTYVVTNFDTIRLEWRFFSAHHWFHVIVDEAHAIKNRSTQRSVAIKSINCYSRLALTGTPMANKPYDIWSLLHFLEPGKEFDYRGCRHRLAPDFWGDFDSFLARWCEVDGNGKVVGGHNLKDLHTLLEARIMTRWRKKEVAKYLPELTPHIVPIALSGPQTDLYNDLRAGFIQWPELIGDKVHMNQKQLRSVLAQLTYFRRATSMSVSAFTQSIGGKKPAFAPNLNLVVSNSSAKLDWVRDMLEYQMDDDSKLVIFTNWRSTAFELESALAEYNPVVVMGGVTERQALVDKFWGDSRVLIGTSAAFEGLNLQCAADVVWMDMPWVPMSATQGNGRIHRIGQNEACNVWYLLADQTIDTKVFGLVQNKAKDANDAIDGGVGDEVLQFAPWEEIV